MPTTREPIGGRVAAAARTVAAGTAQMLTAWCTGSPLPEAPDRRCDGVADFAARRARVSQSLFLTDSTAAALMELGDGEPGPRESAEQMEMIYDGANTYLRHADGWLDRYLPDRSRRPARPV